MTILDLFQCSLHLPATEGPHAHDEAFFSGEEVDSLMVPMRTNTLPLPDRTSSLGNGLSVSQRARAASLSAMPSNMPGGPCPQPVHAALTNMAGPAPPRRPAAPPYTRQTQVSISSAK